MFRQKEAHVGQSENGISPPPSPTGALDGYELRRTLDEYEVEEIDGHDIARLLPMMASTGEH